MSQATFSIRMDTDLKKQFDDMCEEMGMNATTAFNIFARTVVREQRIPFEINANTETKKSKKNETKKQLLELLANLDED